MIASVYLQRRGFLHELPPILKLFLLLILCVIPLLGIPLWALALMFAGLVATALIAKIPVAWLWKMLRPILLLAVFVFAFHIFYSDWQTGLIFTLRFLIMVLAASMVSATTRSSDLVVAIEKLAQPLKKLGLNPRVLGLMIALVLQLIPSLLRNWQSLQDARKARGASGFSVLLFLPLIILALKQADELAMAMEARGY